MSSLRFIGSLVGSAIFAGCCSAGSLEVNVSTGFPGSALLSGTIFMTVQVAPNEEVYFGVPFKDNVGKVSISNLSQGSYTVQPRTDQVVHSCHLSNCLSNYYRL